MFGKKVLSLASATALASALALAVASPSMASGKTSKPTRSNSVYIVRMADAPAIAYDGKIKGYAATRPGKGRKINLDDPNVGRYIEHLSLKHDRMLQKVGGGTKLYSYGYAFNGFAAELSAAQAGKLKATQGVLSVTKDAVRQVDTSTTPTFLGLSGPGGFYAVHGVTGENVVIGVIDGGVWPENLSFSDRVDANGNPTGKKGTLAYQPIAGWNGKCTSGEQFSQDHCNRKLIGARFYNAGWGGSSQINRLFPFEFISPRDWDGHGTHTASTAGGNRNVPATGALTSAFGKVNGIAPRARLAVYKACWADQPRGGGCFNSDTVAAIDQAVADGVDVINFSISGSQTSFLDPVEVAFLFAADAGVFVATSAGNAGADSAVAHAGPWVTTVAAGTHDRNGEGSVTLGNAAIHPGASYANALASRPLIDSTAAGLAGANAALVEFCAPAVLDPAKVAGKIVLCKRGGGIALVDKSGSVAAAGGAGAIIYNDPAAGAATSILALLHPVPAVHVLAANGVAIKAYIAGAGASATASIAQSTIVLNAPAPSTASFSSRGPLQAGGGDLLKPDVMAPGQDILAAVAPPDNGGRSFDLYSGTSMSSPHVAGLAALFKELHPGWSPMAIKSALMTSAGDILELPNTDAGAIFRQGAGHVQPGLAANPGLVFDHNFNDWLAFLCGTGQLTGAGCAAIAIDPSDLNVPSIAIGDLPGIQTVTRRVTNVSGNAASYTPEITGMEGFSVGVSPVPLVVPAGETRSFTVRISNIDAELDTYTGGQLTWNDGSSTNVRIPIVVRPIVISAPPEVTGTGGAIAYAVKFGYSGNFEASPRGLVAADITAGTVADDPTNGTCSLTSPNAQLITVNVPAGTAHARFSLFDADVNPGSDLDLCVFEGTTQVGTSTSGTSAEEVNLENPEAADYTVVVHGWGVVGSSPFKLHTWVLPDSDAGNMTVTAPTTASAGTSASITLNFSGLSSATRYLGAVAYSDGLDAFGRTLVRVDTP